MIICFNAITHDHTIIADCYKRTDLRLEIDQTKNQYENELAVFFHCGIVEDSIQFTV